MKDPNQTLLEVYIGEGSNGSGENEATDEERKPNGYWKEWSHLEKALKNLADNLGHFPTQRELRESGNSSLSVASIQHHGGLNAVRRRMGYGTLERDKNYWKDFEHVERELKGLEKELGRLPTYPELEQLGRQDLINGIQKYHGGYNSVRKKLNSLDGINAGKKESGTWSEFGKVEEAVESLAEKLGHFPSSDEVRRHLGNGIIGAIYKLHGGFRKVRKRMGRECSRKQVGYWEDFKLVESELIQVIEETGSFPSGSVLQRLGKGSLLSGIGKYHNGLNSVRERMGYQSDIKQTSYWKDLENVRKEIAEISEKLGHFPTTTELSEMGFGGMLDSISSVHGGYNSVRQKLGADLIQKPRGYWENWGNFEREMREVIDMNNGEFPAREDFRRLNRKDLEGAAFRNYGGLNAVRERLGFKRKSISAKYWKEFPNVKQELEEVIDYIGHFPTQTELANLGRGDINRGCQLHGGLTNVRKILGYALARNERGYWIKFENIESEMERAIKEVGHFPSLRELKNYGFSNLLSALRKHGGIESVRERMDYTEPQNGSLLEVYVGGENGQVE